MKRYGETLPFMVVFTKNINHVNPKRVVREVRSTNNKKSHKSKYSTVMKTAQYETWNTICRIHSLYIDFKDLNWQVNVFSSLMSTYIKVITHTFLGLDYSTSSLFSLLLCWRM